MARKKKTGKKPIEQYDHKGKKRVNNPPVGLVTQDIDKDIFCVVSQRAVAQIQLSNKIVYKSSKESILL